MERVRSLIWILLGTSVVAAGIQVFFEPNALVVGGVSGLGIVLNGFLSPFNRAVPLWLTNIVVNIPLLLLAWRILGRTFLQRTVFATFLLSGALWYTSFLPTYQGDMLLVCVFGGVCIGLGTGCVLRGVATTGGSDLAAALIHARHPHISVAQALFAVDAVIMLLGLFIFGPEKAMYALIAGYVGSRCLGVVLEGLGFAKAAFIISDAADEIAKALLTELARGVTALDGRGMYTKNQKKILLCVFGQKEIVKIKQIILRIDPQAFVFLTDSKEVLGEGFQNGSKQTP